MLLLILFISVGYAILTTTININGTGKVKNAKWDVHFENVQVTNGSVEPTTAANITDDTSASFAITLEKPGDFYEFTIDVVNAGTIDAMISTISNTSLTEEQQRYLTYTVSYVSGAAIVEKQLLGATKTEKLKLRAEFKKDITAADLLEVDTTLTLTLSTDYVQADGTAVAVVHPVCRRATTLHTAVCDSERYAGCHSSGMEWGDKITYGNLGTVGEAPEAGDVFDCDVNGDGTFDAEKERFYYVCDLDTNADYAVLIYYNNVSSGVPNNRAGFAYDSAEKPRENGPVTAAKQLPTTKQWSKVSLTSTTRAITDDKGTTYKTDFSYAGKAARMLTLKEVETACGIAAGSYGAGELDSCNYLMENTEYSNSSFAWGYWLETNSSSDVGKAWRVYGYYRNRAQYRTVYNLDGVRPAIEVPKSKIAS